MNSIFAKICSRENISNSLFAKISSRENKVLYSIQSNITDESIQMIATTIDMYPLCGAEYNIMCEVQLNKITPNTSAKYKHIKYLKKQEAMEVMCNIDVFLNYKRLQ